ncbi:helix-turn-helix domain-containing protein [Paenibacillus sp. MBLB4367]|uniref:helix-turn-helix domain-containing protein n=1 Tax=Paenibacillus sp. MBLB4367 TaxID=3384767 RepID=UPI003908050B
MKGELQSEEPLSGKRLQQGELIFLSPGESLTVCGGSRTTVLRITFVSFSTALDSFRTKCFSLGEHERRMVTDMIMERLQSGIGCDQLLTSYFEIFLIRLLRRGTFFDIDNKIYSGHRETVKGDISKNIIEYIENNTSDVSMENICRFFSYSKSRISTLFKQSTGYSVMEYTKKHKIEKAKALIREGKYSFTEIAEYLGYSSIHYFSKDFKKFTGMTPSVYAKSDKPEKVFEYSFQFVDRISG